MRGVPVSLLRMLLSVSTLEVPEPHQLLCLLHMQLDYMFKNLWADHGDDIARQYAGTGALKSGFTRTGEHAVVHVVMRGWCSRHLYGVAAYYG